ncbi:hypothetical protein HMPREF1139_1363 [Campylobacter sp. FOBRC14]|nr:hypothetical protein HMPREF1139_1363 [Campylobacter sp. FOBRC14]
MTFSFQSEVKPCEATLSPPIFTSCYALVTRLRYEDREAVAERVNRAIGSVLCGASRVCEASVNFITEPIFLK